MIHAILDNILHNLFKPLLLFFYAGLMIPLFKVDFHFPKGLYQTLTIMLLLGIGWHGGEELSHLVGGGELIHALGFMAVGFVTNIVIGVATYYLLLATTKLRKVDAAAVAGHYGSDSAGTFVTCVGFLASVHVIFAPYMPVMLAVMEIPGCLVALILVSRLRSHGMDANGNLPEEKDYVDPAGPTIDDNGIAPDDLTLLNSSIKKLRKRPLFNLKILHEVFLNPGTFLLFAGVLIGTLSGLQGESATKQVDNLFVFEFQGLLCLFLLEMGITACKRLKDLKSAGSGFVLFGLLAPNLFALFGLLVAYSYASLTGYNLALGSYVLFMVLCGAASYIAVPAVQRLAIPEASPTLPLAASLGLTFTYNVTIGIPVYIEIAKAVTGLRG